MSVEYKSTLILVSINNGGFYFSNVTINNNNMLSGGDVS